MLGWTLAEMSATIRDGEIETVTTCSGRRIELRDVAAKAVDLWSLAAVEEALGRDAARVMPAALRTRKLTVRVQRYQIALLEILAGGGGETVDALRDRLDSRPPGERVGRREVAGPTDAGDVAHDGGCRARNEPRSIPG